MIQRSWWQVGDHIEFKSEKDGSKCTGLVLNVCEHELGDGNTAKVLVVWNDKGKFPVVVGKHQIVSDYQEYLKTLDNFVVQ